jgi:PAS domain S-box-containing protein
MESSRRESDAVPLYRSEPALTLTGALRAMESGPDPRELIQEVRNLVQELEIHRAELEVQNRELRESQTLLEESRARYADLYDFAPIAYLTLDRQGRIADANLTAAAFLRTDRANLLGRVFAALVPEPSRGQVRAHVRACLNENIRISTEIVVSRRGGRVATMQMVSTPLLNGGGDITGCRTTLTDISAVKHAQDVLSFLARASARLSSSFDYAANLSGVIQDAVPLLADVCIADVRDPAGGLTRVELVDSSRDRQRVARAARLQRPLPAAGSALAAALELRRPILIREYRPLTASGDGDGLTHEGFVRACAPRSIMYVPMVMRGEALGVLTLLASDSGRQFAGPDLSTAEDLANRVAMAIENARLYDDAQRAVRAREQVLSFVSHDLKNPLMGILLSVDMLLSGAPEPDRRRGWKQLERIRRGVQQMRHMVEDLLDVSSIDAGRLSIELGDEDLAKILEDVIELLRPIARDKGIELTGNLAHEACRVRCDRDRVIQVLYNLVGNALKFTPRAGQVTVTAERAGAQVLIAVADTGSGIPADLAPRLFGRYAQAAESARRGRGLGLFISRAIVQAHGGSIWADLGVERGSRFCFTLPLASDDQSSTIATG